MLQHSTKFLSRPPPSGPWKFHFILPPQKCGCLRTMYGISTYIWLIFLVTRESGEIPRLEIFGSHPED